MTLRPTIAIAIGVMLINLLAGPVPAQNDPNQKLHAKVRKIGLRNEITVMLPNALYHGQVESIGDNGFTINEVDLKKTIDLKYTEVKKVESGYGHKFDKNGQRIPPRKNHWGLILGVAAITLPVTLLAIALHSDY